MLRRCAAAVVLEDDVVRVGGLQHGLHDLLGVDLGGVPVLRVHRPADGAQVAGRAGLEDGLRPVAVGGAEDGRGLVRVRECIVATIHLREYLLVRVVRQVGVVPGVVRDRVAGRGDLAHQGEVSRDLLADHVEGGLDVVLLEDLEDLGRVDRAGSVVQGQRDGPRALVVDVPLRLGVDRPGR